MGLANSIISNHSFHETLKADRIIDHENGGIYVGVIGPKDSSKLSGQAIRFGNSRLYRLEYFEKSDSNLTYTFDSNAQLKFYKRPIVSTSDNKSESTIIVNYSCPDQDLNVTQTWIHSKLWKNPKWGELSTELDEIGKFIGPNINQDK